MYKWKEFCLEFCENTPDSAQLRQIATQRPEFSIYPDSIHCLDEAVLFLAKEGHKKVLVVYPDGAFAERFSGDPVDLGGKIARLCPADLVNCRVIREIFPFTRPVSFGDKAVTLGLGDRLGLASPGHLEALADKDIFPVLAQQSIRELNLTGRTYDDVLAAASWAVFMVGYEKGFGADGDHLKTAQEVKMALDSGVTMITLDCSEHIKNDVPDLDQAQVKERLAQIPAEEKDYLAKKWFGRQLILEKETRLEFTPEDMERIVLIYRDAIRHAERIYHDLIGPSQRAIDFEMSIDETLTPTTPQAHYYVAETLQKAGVKLASLAPRFIGEFQKGIDYRGDLAAFRADFAVHSQIARQLGYKISVHSGSDKFSVFPAIGELTNHVLHLKTAGTSWLEAVRVIAKKDPVLYRELHQFALENLAEARQYYLISARAEDIAPLADIADADLADFLDQDDARQVLHITYGLMLKAKNADGTERFRPRIYTCLIENEKDYDEDLRIHIGRHLSQLGL